MSASPGSMLWLGRLGEAPVLGIASCAGFGKNTSLDLVLPFVFASGRADAEDFIRLGDVAERHERVSPWWIRGSSRRRSASAAGCRR